MTGGDAKRGIETGFSFSGGKDIADCACVVDAITKETTISTRLGFIVVLATKNSDGKALDELVLPGLIETQLIEQVIESALTQ